MNREETTQILIILASNYKFYNEQMSEKGKSDVLVKTWQGCFNDIPYQIVANAVKKVMLISTYPPTVAEVRKQAVETINPNTSKSAIEAWNEAYQMICSGSYMMQEEFEKHSEEVKKFFGSVRQLKDYAGNEDFNMDVVRSNFLKQYDVLVQKKQEQKLIPLSMQEFTQKLAQKTDINQIGEVKR